MRQTEIKLKQKDRRMLDEICTKGVHMARALNRAHILRALDRKIPEGQIVEVLGVGRTAIWRTRAAYLERGLDFALQDMPRSGRPKQYQTDDEAEVTALACSDPPTGAQRWTMALLMGAARSQPRMRGIGRETIRRLLKKTASNHGAS